MIYLIPFVYGFATRAKTLFYKISFIIVFLLPIFILVLFSNPDISYVLPRFTLAFIALYSVYEIGYIFNDTHTVRFEKNPTYRLDMKERLKVERMSIVLIAVRVLTVITCSMALYYLQTMNLIEFIIMLGLLNFFYALHNYFRSAINILTIIGVITFKYVSVLVLFVSLKDYFFYFIIMMLIVPIVRIIEFAAKERFGIKFFKKFNYDIFRVYYYGFLTGISGILTFMNNKFMCLLVLAMYFLIFRIGSFIALKSDSIKEVRKYASGFNK